MKLAILDGSSLFFRAFYALPPLATKSGIYTNAIVGFYNMFLRLLKEEEPEGVVIAFDKSKETFRKKKYADYKGTRKPTPEELKMQIPMLKELAAAHGLCFIEKEGYEADDIIGTLAKKGAALNHEVVVVTGDRDALQLIGKNLSVYLTKKGISEIKIYTEEVFREEYGMEPIRLIDLKGLMGDTSDNIPGVPSVGEKIALKLLHEFKTLENVFDNIHKISGKKLKEKLVEYKEQAFLSKELATICLKVPDLELDTEKYAISPDFSAMQDFCKKYELSKLWQNFSKEFKAPSMEGSLFDSVNYDTSQDLNKVEKKISFDFERIYDMDSLESFFEYEPISLVFHTEGRTVDTNVLGVMLKNSDRMAYVAADSLIFSQTISFLERKKKLWTYDIKNTYHAGFLCLDNLEDVFLKLYLLYPEAEGNFLRLASKLLPEQNIPQKEKDSLKLTAMQTALIYELAERADAELKEKGLDKLYETIEKPLIQVLYEMERAGIFLDTHSVKLESDKTAQKLSEIEQKIYSLAGVTFNLNSPKILSEVLFEKLQYPHGKKTKTGYSTDMEVLLGLKSTERPIIDEILSYRALSKLKSTYLDALPLLVSPKTQRIHTTFNQKIAATGRLTSSDPNLQNIPVRSDEGRSIRSLFLPRDGYDFLLSADYSQIELRILAHLSKDENMVAAFLRNEDIHKATAAEVFGAPIDEVTSEMRRRAKAVNFGIVYGISDYGLSRDLGITRREAKEYIEKYFEKFRGIKAFIDKTVEDAKKLGFVKTLYGRLRALPEINNSNFNIRSNAERMAMNTPIQGTAADIIKLAMIEVSDALKKAGLSSRILLQVHDELVIETTKNEVQNVGELVKNIMENVVKLDVPLTADVHTGENWGQAK